MAIQPKLINIRLKKELCLKNFSEDDIRLLVDSLEAEIIDEELSSLVHSTGGIPVKFIFGSDGNFSGVYAKQGGRQIPLIFGVGGNELSIFKGAPSLSNPGPGWEVEVELTRQYLSQPPSENDWQIFFASRAAVINTV